MSHTTRLSLILPLLLAAAFVGSIQQVHAQAGNTTQPPAVTPAQTLDEKPAVGGYGLINPLRSNSIPQIIGQLVAWLGGLAGSLFFFYLLWGGVEWMTAGGSNDRVKSATKKIQAAIFGIAVVVFAYLAVATIIGFVPR